MKRCLHRSGQKLSARKYARRWWRDMKRIGIRWGVKLCGHTSDIRYVHRCEQRANELWSAFGLPSTSERAVEGVVTR